MMYWDRRWRHRAYLEMVLRMARFIERRMSGDMNEKLGDLAVEWEVLSVSICKRLEYFHLVTECASSLDIKAG